MTTAILDINDQSLLITTGLDFSYRESGFAQLTNNGIICGTDAHAMHWQAPQSSFNDYWKRLNQLSLPNKQPWARHNADIAFAQLQKMLLAADSPDRVIFSIPGSVSDPQLALLAGMLNATSSTLLGVIDSGLLAALALRQDSWIVELQLHQTVLSLVRYEHRDDQTNLNIDQQEIIPDLGILQIHNTVANHISERFIKDYRYDPLHSSSGEQAIYDQMTAWLSDLVSHGEVVVTLNTPSGDLSLTLHKEDITNLLQYRLSHLNRVLSAQPEVRAAFTDSAKLNSLLTPDYGHSDTINRIDVAVSCLDIVERIFPDNAEPTRVSSLQIGAATAPQKVPSSDSRRSIATHILHDGQAWSLAKSLSITVSEGQLQLGMGINKKASVCLTFSNNSLQILHQQDNCKVILPEKCSSDETLIVGGYTLKLIEVING